MSIDGEMIAKMTVEIVAGITEENSKYITDEESREAWRSLKGSADLIAKSGTVVAIEPEWGDKDYDDLYGDDYDEYLAEALKRLGDKS